MREEWFYLIGILVKLQHKPVQNMGQENLNYNEDFVELQYC
jgi:hypothetical protein